MTVSFSTLTTVRKTPAQVLTLQDVWDWIVSHAPDPSQPKTGNPHGYRLQYLTKLKSHCGAAPLSTLPADLAAFDRDFPKVHKGVHPRPDLHQPLETYKKWRQGARKALEIATGATAAKTKLRARQDGWADLLAAIKLHSKNGGCIHPGSSSPVVRLADMARRAGLEPWDLTRDKVLDKLEAQFAHPTDRGILRKAQKFLNDFGCLPELAALLPATPLPVFPTLRAHQALPAHIDAFLVQLADRAAAARDEVTGKDSQPVKDTTKEGWLAALRHHVRALPACPVDPAPALEYTHPVTDLNAVNDVPALFEPAHLYATIRRTAAVEHLPGTIIHVSAYDYYSTILAVLSRNDLLDDATHKAITTCKFMKEGKQLAKGMTAANEAWCRALVRDRERRKRFRNMHRILMVKANEILDTAAAEGRALSTAETTKARQLGTCAAACAIEYAGRPIRMANCLGLRLKGSRMNFFRPEPGHPEWGFFLAADETKSGQKEPMTAIREALYGPQVLAWYLNRIRPMFPHADDSIYLFPAVGTASRPLDKGTFDRWFQRAASAADLPMTFHKWRHGYASLLLSADWGNLPQAAQLLGNTAAVCARNYAWIDEEKLILDGQDRMIASAQADQ